MRGIVLFPAPIYFDLTWPLVMQAIVFGNYIFQFVLLTITYRYVIGKSSRLMAMMCSIMSLGLTAFFIENYVAVPPDDFLSSYYLGLASFDFPISMASLYMLFLKYNDNRHEKWAKKKLRGVAA